MAKRGTARRLTEESTPVGGHVDHRAEHGGELSRLVLSLPDLDRSGLLLQWRNNLAGSVPAHLPTWLLMRVLAYRLQAEAFGDLDRTLLRRLKSAEDPRPARFANRPPATREGAELRPGATLAREWRGRFERVTVLNEGFAWNGVTYGSLSMIAKAITGASWNGHRFFGLRVGRQPGPYGRAALADEATP
jgi:Protein of unknown function (DUF2924)